VGESSNGLIPRNIPMSGAVAYRGGGASIRETKSVKAVYGNNRCLF
jgi:hypothetical protein